MKVILLVVGLALVPQSALAKVFMCVDEATGKTSFTDKACDKHVPGEKVRVDVANPGKGARGAGRNRNNAWQSQRDFSRSGLDYNRARRAAASGKETAIAATAGS